MFTHSGRHVTRTTGAPSLEDIAYHLSHLPRFGGAAGSRWTVAQHSCLVGLICDSLPRPPKTPLQLHGLLHDAAEACVNDVPYPFKTDEQERLEKRILRRIYKDQRLPLPTAAELRGVRYADELALYIEAERLGLNKITTALNVNRLGPPFRTDDVEAARRHIINVPRDGFLELLRSQVKRWQRAS